MVLACCAAAVFAWGFASALLKGRRHRVFCASMADVFDNEEEEPKAA